MLDDTPIRRMHAVLRAHEGDVVPVRRTHARQMVEKYQALVEERDGLRKSLLEEMAKRREVRCG